MYYVVILHVLLSIGITINISIPLCIGINQKNGQGNQMDWRFLLLELYLLNFIKVHITCNWMLLF